MKQFLVVIFLAIVTVSSARAESVDVTTFTPPAGWTRSDRADTTEYSVANEKSGAGGSITILHSMAGAANARANFDNAWAQLVAALPDVPAPTVSPVANQNGWQVVRGSTKYTFEGRAATTTIVTATRDTSYAIVVAITIGTGYQKDVDKVLASLRFAAPVAATTAAPAELAGAWGFSTGGAMSSARSAPWLSDRREYSFDGKNNYTFLRRHNVDQDPDLSIIRERGTYAFANNVLTLTPTKTEREVWSKVRSGANAGAYDKLLRREKVPMEKTSYGVSFAMYLDTQVPNLLLTPSAATKRDGNFNASTQYRLFRPDGKYYTAVPPTP